MNLFKSYTFSWKQIGVFKISLLAIGMILGAYFADFVKDNIVVVGIVAVVATIYVIVVSIKQTGTK